MIPAQKPLEHFRENMPGPRDDLPSLESLIESEDLGLETLHPGGLEITEELARLCHAREGADLLDVASGTGESACFLASELRCRVVGVDVSASMVQRARAKALERKLDVRFQQGDAHELPFEENTFEVVISECTTCILDKERAIGEMVRVARRGGYVGIHDICWKDDTPEEFKRRLEEIEGERPETLEGWVRLFERSGLVDVKGFDRSHLIPGWSREVRGRLGIRGQLRLFWTVLRRWGIRGYRNLAETERIFTSPQTGYGIIVGRKAA